MKLINYQQEPSLMIYLIRWHLTQCIFLCLQVSKQKGTQNRIIVNQNKKKHATQAAHVNLFYTIDWVIWLQ